jgi:uncharacterized membrane protein YqhA
MFLSNLEATSLADTFDLVLDNFFSSPSKTLFFRVFVVLTLSTISLVKALPGDFAASLVFLMRNFFDVPEADFFATALLSVGEAFLAGVLVLTTGAFFAVVFLTKTLVLDAFLTEV